MLTQSVAAPAASTEHGIMDRIICLEAFTAAITAIVCISHILHPRLWGMLFIDLMKHPYAGLYVGAFTLPLGLLIALGHNVWVPDIPVIVTIFGWGWTLKGTIYLLRPATVQQVGSRHMQHPERFRIAGGIMLVASLAIAGNLVMDRL